MKHRTILVLAFAPILCGSLLTSCLKESSSNSSLETIDLQEKPHPKSSGAMSSFNTGAQSAMEAGSYWAALSIIAKNNHAGRRTNTDQEQEINSSWCGLFSLFSAPNNLHFFKTTE